MEYLGFILTNAIYLSYETPIRPKADIYVNNWYYNDGKTYNYRTIKQRITITEFVL